MAIWIISPNAVLYSGTKSVGVGAALIAALGLVLAGNVEGGVMRRSFSS